MMSESSGPTTAQPRSLSASKDTTPLPEVHPLSSLHIVEVLRASVIADGKTHAEPESRYVVRLWRGETVLEVVESPTGSAISLRVSEPNGKDLLYLTRRRSCGPGSCGMLGCGCFLRRIDVQKASGQPLGSVEEAWTPLVPVFRVKDQDGNLLYRLELTEANSVWPGSNSKEYAEFEFSDRDGDVVTGFITRGSDGRHSFRTKLAFPDVELDLSHKALLLSAAVMIESMFPKTPEKNGWSLCC